MEKKIVKKAAWQGDLMVRKVESLPEGVERVEAKGGQHIVAHSETGHNHVVDAPGLSYYTVPNNPMVAYLVQESVTSFEFTHQRSFDTHNTLEMLGDFGDVWEIRRQREYTPEGLRRVED